MPIRAKYVHTNLIARDWKRLVQFYREVFGCEPKGPERDLSAAWLDRVNSVPNARLRGVHLRLPGYDDDGPTLEIFSYDQLIERGLPRANECGFGHIAFAVDNVDEALQAVIAAGGGAVGEIATAEVDRRRTDSCWFMREIPKVTLSSCKSGVEPELVVVS